jgi:exosortase/archaeosortase family protein
MNIGFFKYFDAWYFLRFLLLFLCLYYFHLFYYGVITPAGGFYSSFLHHHLNYIEWTKSCILYGAKWLTRMLGFPTHVENQLTLKVYDRPGVSLNFACLGLGICSFWVAFIVAHKTNWLIKLYWCISGVSIIYFINCLRITLLLVSMEMKWSNSYFLDHHDLFNLVCYTVLFFLIYLYDSKIEKNACREKFAMKIRNTTA